MPFANLPPHEKDAFFALLDEYFTSRPDLLSRVSGAAGQEYPETQSTAPSPSLLPPGASAAALTTAAQRTLANPAASRMLAAGIQRAATTGTGHGRAGGGLGHGHTAAAVAPLAMAALPSLVGPASGARNNGAAGNYDGHNANPNPPSAGVGVGRVAAAAQAFSSSSPKPANSNRLVPQKKFGDVDVSSAGAMFRSLRGSTAAKNAPPASVHTPSAFAGKKAASEFAPPPVRRVPASSAVPATPEPEEEEAAAGAWAEALYDYTSEEAGDLHLRAGERVWVTEQTSEDWWTGEVDGRSGMIPASYVKLL